MLSTSNSNMKIWLVLLLAIFLATEIQSRDVNNAPTTSADSQSLATTLSNDNGTASLEAQLIVEPTFPHTANNSIPGIPLRRKRKTKHKSAKQQDTLSPTINSTAVPPTHAESSNETLSQLQVPANESETPALIEKIVVARSTAAQEFPNNYVAFQLPQRQRLVEANDVKNPQTISTDSEDSNSKPSDLDVTAEPSSQRIHIPLRVTTKPPPPIQKHTNAIFTSVPNSAQHYGAPTISNSIPSSGAIPLASAPPLYCPCLAITSPHTVEEHTTKPVPEIHTGNIIRIATTPQPQKPTIKSISQVLSSVDASSTQQKPIASVSRGKSAYSYPSWTGESPQQGSRQDYRGTGQQERIQIITKVLGNIDTASRQQGVSMATHSTYEEQRKPEPQPVTYLPTVVPKFPTTSYQTTTTVPQISTTLHPCPISTLAPVYHTSQKPYSKPAHILKVTEHPQQVQVAYQPSTTPRPDTHLPIIKQDVNNYDKPKISKTSSSQYHQQQHEKLSEDTFVQAMHHLHFESRKEASNAINNEKQKTTSVVLNVVQHSPTPQPSVEILSPEIFTQKRPPAPTTLPPIAKVHYIEEQHLRVQKEPIISPSTPSPTASLQPINNAGATVEIIIPQPILSLPKPIKPQVPPAAPIKPLSIPTKSPSFLPTRPPVTYKSLKHETSTPCPGHHPELANSPLPIVPVTSPKPYATGANIISKSTIYHVQTSPLLTKTTPPVSITPLPPKLVTIPSKPTHSENNNSFHYELVHTEHHQPQNAFQIILSHVHAPAVATTEPLYVSSSTTSKPSTVGSVQYHQSPPPPQVIIPSPPNYQQPQQVQTVVKQSTHSELQKIRYGVTPPQAKPSQAVTTATPQVYTEAIAKLQSHELSNTASISLDIHGHDISTHPCPIPISSNTQRLTPFPTYNPDLTVSATPTPAVTSKQVVLSQVQQSSASKYEHELLQTKAQTESVAGGNQFHSIPTSQEPTKLGSYELDQKPREEFTKTHATLPKLQTGLPENVEEKPIPTVPPVIPKPVPSQAQVNHSSRTTAPIYTNAAQSNILSEVKQTSISNLPYPTVRAPQVITRNLAEVVTVQSSQQLPAQLVESSEQLRGETGINTPPQQVNFAPIRLQPILVQGPNGPHFEPPPNLPPGYGYNKGFEKMPPTPPPYEFKRIIPQTLDSNNELARKLRSP